LADSYPDLKVEMITSAGAGTWLSTRAQRHLRRAFDRLRITVRADTWVTQVIENAMVLDSGATLTADVVVWAAGFRVPSVAGQAAAHAPDGNETRVSCQTGLPMGQHVADVVADRLTGGDPRPFRLRYVWQNISLGRRDGVTQFTHADDSRSEIPVSSW
jgi:NADH dehydrogenase FAD-containing subunit